MPRKDTFFLRTSLTTSGTNYVSDNIDISAYTDPARGRVLVVDRAWVSFGTDGGGPIQPTDLGTSAISRSVGVQACSEKQTTLVDLDNNSLFLETALYAFAVAKYAIPTGPEHGVMTYSVINDLSFSRLSN